MKFEQSEALIKVEEASGLAKDSAVALREKFAGFYTDIEGWREKALMVTKPADETHQRLARDVRLGLRRVRIDIENTRKALKADSLARGKAIDGYANVLKYLCEPVEQRLLAVEQYAERVEAARIAQLVADRSEALTALGADPSAYNLGIMSLATFSLVCAVAEKAKADREEAARQAEADRIAREQADRIAREKAEKEAAVLRAEAAALRAESVKREKALAAERTQARHKQEAVTAKLIAEREKRERAEREAEDARRRERELIEAGKVAAEMAAAEERAKKAEAGTIWLVDVDRKPVRVKVETVMEMLLKDKMRLFGMSLEVIMEFQTQYELRRGPEPMTVESVREIFGR